MGFIGVRHILQKFFSVHDAENRNLLLQLSQFFF